MAPVFIWEAIFCAPGSGLLLLNYIGAAVLACLMPAAFNPVLMIGVHAVFGGKLISETLHLDQERYQLAAIRRFGHTFYIIE